MHKTIASIAQRAAVMGALLASAALPAAATAATTSHNALDPAFGTRGTVEHVVDAQRSNDPWKEPYAVWPGGANRILAELYDGATRRLTASGVPDPSFGTNGAIAGQRLPGGTWISNVYGGPCCDDLFVSEDADGHLLPQADAFESTVQGLEGGYGSTFVGLADGTVLDFTQGRGELVQQVSKIRLDGTVVRSGPASPDLAGIFFAPHQLASGSGAIVATGGGVVKLRNDGSLDPQWGLRVHALSHTYVVQIAPWDRGGVAVLGQDNDYGRYELTLISRTGHIARRVVLAANAVVRDTGEWKFSYALAADPQGRLILARSYGNHAAVTVSRYRSGRVDKTFGRQGVVHVKASISVDAAGLTVAPDGRIVVLGALQRYGTVYDDRQDIPSPGWESHGTVLWRLKAK